MRNKLCWVALACLVVPMFASYFFDDMFSQISRIFENPGLLELGWDSAGYGFYAGGYSFLCVWGALVLCGILLDIYGVRTVGSVFVGLMVGGAALVTYAISHGFAPSVSLRLAYVGCMLFGLGSEIAGVAVTRSIARWFKGGKMALAMGLQLSVARLGMALAFILSPKLVLSRDPAHFYTLAETSRPAMVGLCLLFAGAILWAVFVALDARHFPSVRKGEISSENRFRFADITKILTNPRFLMIALLCVFFYCCIIKFKKFGAEIICPRFSLDDTTAAWMMTMLPFFTVVFTPLFGSLVDRTGKATVWMLGGSLLVLVSHLLIAFAPSAPFWGYFAIGILGIGYSLVPSAMWPTIPRIVPEKNLGTAYSLTYWIQNIGMLIVPVLVGGIFKRYPREIAAVRSEYIFIALAVAAVAVAVMLFRSSVRRPELGIDTPAGKPEAR